MSTQVRVHYPCSYYMTSLMHPLINIGVVDSYINTTRLLVIHNTVGLYPRKNHSLITIYQCETMYILVEILFLLSCLYDHHSVDAHGRLVKPPSRSSMWRYGFNTPTNYEDNQLFCGGASVSHDNIFFCSLN